MSTLTIVYRTGETKIEYIVAALAEHIAEWYATLDVVASVTVEAA